MVDVLAHAQPSHGVLKGGDMGNLTEKEFVIVMHFKGHVEIVCPVCHLNVLKVEVDAEEKEEK